MADFFEDHYTDKYVEVNGLRLHYTDWGGSASKPPVLLVHGLQVQGHTWDPVADTLRNDYHVYCLDMRGHGDSDWSARRNGDAGYMMPQMVSDIYEFAKKLDIIPFSYVGHSLGSRTGIGYGGMHPETLTHLVLSDMGPEMAQPRNPATAPPAAAPADGPPRPTSPQGMKTEEQVRAFFAEQNPTWKPIFVDLHARYQVRKNYVGRYVLKSDPELSWLWSAAILPEVPVLWDLLGKITPPTLVLRGLQSPLLSEEIADRMIKTLPNGRQVTFNTGHQIGREAPEEYQATIRDFLSN